MGRIKGCGKVETWHATSLLFLGSTEAVLAKIKARAAVDFPTVEVSTYSPPFKPEFSDEDNAAMIAAINAVNPDVLFVGMTAPKQEKWAWKMINDKRLVISDKYWWLWYPYRWAIGSKSYKVRNVLKF